jgi:hypothetical protein
MAGHVVEVNRFDNEDGRKSFLFCKMLAAGVAFVASGGFGAAHAAPFFFGPFDGGTRYSPPDAGSRVAPWDGGFRHRPQYLSSKRATGGTRAGKSREDAKAAPAADLPKGTLQIVVSIGQQRVTLYSNGARVAQSAVSTGVPGRPTPMGVFSVIQKDRYHHSNLYSNAPMPYMQRITWSGVALHEGPLPGHPASHGCIRLTHDFAARLWTTTKLGARVFVLRNDTAPEDFSHPKLFQPIQKQQEVSAEQSNDQQPAVAGDGRARGAGRSAIVMAQTTADAAPRAEALPGSTSGEAVPEDGAAAPPAGPEPANPAPAVIEALKPLIDPLKAFPPRSRTAEPAKYSGQVAVFVSRREKKVFVRQGFEPVFDMPVEIARPDEPLGTHVFTALELRDGGARMRWNVLSIPSAEPQRRTVLRDTRRSGRRALDLLPAQAAEAKPASSAADALDRIKLPQEAVDRISEILNPGSSLVISDNGLGGETGRATDFIVLTR